MNRLSRMRTLQCASRQTLATLLRKHFSQPLAGTGSAG